MTTHEELFDALRENFPPSLREQGWYITTVRSSLADGHPMTLTASQPGFLLGRNGQSRLTSLTLPLSHLAPPILYA
jgi:hypothetical protein